VNVGSITASGNDIGLKNVTSATGQSFTANTGGIITMGGTTYTNTTGDISFNGAALLSGDTTVSTTGNVTFGGTLNGAHTLLVNTTSGGGITTFGGAVGGLTPLTSITTDADGTVRINGGAVTTTNDQIYNDAVTLGADTTLNGLNITFAGKLDSSGGARDLIVNAGAVATFGGQVVDWRR